MTYHPINNLNKVTAFVYLANDFIGCAVIFKNSQEILLITAFHVIFPNVNKFKKKEDSTKIIEAFETQKKSIRIFDEKNKSYTINNIVGDYSEYQNRDVILLNLDGDINELEEICFLNPSNSTNSELIFRCKSANIKEPKSIYSKELIENINDSFYYINIDKSILEDSSGRWGASALEGISGSGIFLKSHKQLVIVGIVSSIPDDGMLGKIKCCNSYFFTNLKPSLIKHDNLEYNFGINHIHQEISSIKDSNLDSIISEWENNPDNKEYNENINRKLSVLHVPNKVKQEKTKIIRNLLLGDIFLSERINNYPNIELAYSESHQIFSDDDMTIYTNNRISANEKYHEIRKDYLEILLDTLKPHGLMKDKIQLLRNKDIAFWLANCDLDFLDDK